MTGLDLELPEHGTGARAARRAAERAGPTRRWMVAFSAALLTAAVLAAGLAFVGVQTLRDSSAGRRVTSADPSEPDFEGLLDPTPTLLVVHRSGDGSLTSAAVLALGQGDRGGSVLLLPPSVMVGDGADAVSLSVVVAYDGTVEGMRGAAEVITGVGIQDVVGVDDARWAELVAPVAPLAIANPDELDDFGAGELALGAEQVGPWLRAARPDESELGRLYRQQLLWEAWVAAVAASDDPASVPGELDTGLGRFVRGLASGRTTVDTLPVTAIDDGAEATTYRVDRSTLNQTITDLVPFPTGTAVAPRTRVRLLDGTGDEDHVGRVAPEVVASSSSVVIVGNADSFDYQTTEIRYHQPDQREAAERLREALGTGQVVEDVRPIDAFDVTIVLGTDT